MDEKIYFQYTSMAEVPKQATNMNVEVYKISPDIGFTKAEGNRYMVSYKGETLDIPLSTTDNVKLVAKMIEKTLVQYDSCQARFSLMGDCSIRSKQTVFSGLTLEINDGAFASNVIDEETFRGSIARKLTGQEKKMLEKIQWNKASAWEMLQFSQAVGNIIRKNGEVLGDTIGSEDNLYNMEKTFAEFMNRISQIRGTEPKAPMIAEKILPKEMIASTSN